jgi:hypothetical protein
LKADNKFFYDFLFLHGAKVQKLSLKKRRYMIYFL